MANAYSCSSSKVTTKGVDIIVHSNTAFSIGKPLDQESDGSSLVLFQLFAVSIELQHNLLGR